MSTRTGSAAIVARLDALLGTPDLPRPLYAQAKRLRARLTTDVRIAVVGPPKSGKSRLQEMFAACAGLPDDAALPRLGDVSFLEPSGGHGIEDRRAALEQALEGADILLWCTQHFDDQEQALWRLVPEARRDHAFLVLTKADALYRDGLLSDRFAALQETAAEEFLGLFPVATLQALGALGSGGAPDMALLTSSGGAALITAIGGHVARGRRADVDNALMFLRRYAGLAAEAVPTRPAAPTAPVAGPARGPVTRPVTGPVSGPAAAPPPAPAARPVAAPVAASARDSHADPSDFLSQADDRLRACGRALLQEVEAADADSADFGDILRRCADTLEQLSEMILEMEVNGAPLTPWHEEILEASEMMLLLRLEEGRGPAEDAVALMLQLRREIATRKAA